MHQLQGFCLSLDLVFAGLEPENGFRCALPCEANDTTFDSIFTNLHLNESDLFLTDEDGDDGDLNYCKPFVYTQPIGKVYQVRNFSLNLENFNII